MIKRMSSSSSSVNQEVLKMSLKRSNQPEMKQPEKKQKLDTQSICDYFFTKSSEIKHTYICKMCFISRSQAKGTGRTNLMNHLATTHPTYQSIMAEKKDPSSLKQYFTPKSSNICGWLDWIITNGLPFSSVSDPLFRKYSNLESISVETYMKYMALLTISVEDEIRNLLPDVFSLIFDGWTLDGTSTHFIALYASFMVIIFIFI